MSVAQWKLTIPGGDAEFTTDDLTIAETARCEREVGESWLHAHPLRSAAWACAIMTRFRAREVGEDAAAREVGAMTVRDVLARIEKLDDDDRPTEHADGVPVVDPPPVTDDTETT